MPCNRCNGKLYFAFLYYVTTNSKDILEKCEFGSHSAPHVVLLWKERCILPLLYVVIEIQFWEWNCCFTAWFYSNKTCTMNYKQSWNIKEALLNRLKNFFKKGRFISCLSAAICSVLPSCWENLPRYMFYQCNAYLVASEVHGTLLHFSNLSNVYLTFHLYVPISCLHSQFNFLGAAAAVSSLWQKQLFLALWSSFWAEVPAFKSGFSASGYFELEVEVAVKVMYEHFFLSNSFLLYVIVHN